MNLLSSLTSVNTAHSFSRLPLECAVCYCRKLSCICICNIRESASKPCEMISSKTSSQAHNRTFYALWILMDQFRNNSCLLVDWSCNLWRMCLRCFCRKRMQSGESMQQVEPGCRLQKGRWHRCRSSCKAKPRACSSFWSMSSTSSRYVVCSLKGLRSDASTLCSAQ